MARTLSAKRHAQAIFEIALERDELDRWRSDLKIIADTLREPQLVALLQSPKVSFKKKASLLKQFLAGTSPLAMNLVYLLVVRNRLKMVDDIVAEYERRVDAHYGVEHAEVFTAIPLDSEDRERLKEHLMSISGKKVVLTSRVEPNLLGGLVARIGDKLIDGSVRTKLEALRQSLL